jgi:hypothetical protein
LINHYWYSVRHSGLTFTRMYIRPANPIRIKRVENLAFVIMKCQASCESRWGLVGVELLQGFFIEFQLLRNSAIIE